MKTWKTLFAAALFTAFAAQAQAGAIDALKKFNDDADGISGSFTQTVRSKKKTQTSAGSFKILRPGLGIHQALSANHCGRWQNHLAV